MISIEEINLLKGQNEALLKQNKDLQKQVLDLKAVNTELKTENERLKSCLQEIKAIAKDNIIGCFSNKCDLADEILQKITKAEEE